MQLYTQASWKKVVIEFGLAGEEKDGNRWRSTVEKRRFFIFFEPICFFSFFLS